MDMTKPLPIVASTQLAYFNRFGWRKAIVVVAASLVLINILHYSTAPGISQLHTIYRYFYFLPIVYAALRFGLWGGLITTIAASMVFIPHIVARWQEHPIDSLNDLLVILVLFGAAIITGRTADWMREAQKKQSAIAKDLSDSLHKLECQGAELRRAERLIALGTLAGGLAHQIRNPVGVIRASSQLLDSNSTEEANEIAAVIQDEADRIEQLVSRLLNYAGERVTAYSATDIYHLFAEVQRRVSVAAKPLGIEIITVCARDVTTWELDAEQMEEALVNLCMNAIQALETSKMADGYYTSKGEIRLSAELYHGPENGLQLSVCDNGTGVPQHIQSHIFDPFYSTKDQGVGLGLSVVQRIIEDHLGTIHLNSPNQLGGTTFIIRLPVAEYAAQNSLTRLTTDQYGAYNSGY